MSTPSWTLDGLVKTETAKVDMDAIAGRVARSHALATRSGIEFVHHAIAAGEALLEARAVKRGQWRAWVENTIPDLSYSTAKLYVRLARHKDKLAGRDPSSLREALELLSGEPDSRIDPDMRAEAVRLRRDGMKLRAIADELGVALSTVSEWLREPVPLRPLHTAQAERKPRVADLVRQLLQDAELVDDEDLHGYLVSTTIIDQLRQVVSWPI